MKPIGRIVVLCSVLWLAPAIAAAPAVDQARAALARGDAKAALAGLETYLAGAPADADARFLRGLALAQLGRRQEAIQAFQALTQDFPKLPEPYNNLGVLYAGQGDYEQARDAFESALARDPEYAQAQENLGDVYAALAGKAYARALAQNPASAELRTKSGLIDRINHAAGGAASASR